VAEDIQDVNVPVGITFLPLLVVPDEAVQFDFQLQRATRVNPALWPDPACKVDVQVQIATDGGPWVFYAGFTAEGGLVEQGDGTAVVVSMIQTDLSPGVNRQIRARLRVQGTGLQTRSRMRVT
jgi:hypothetical protein